MRYNRVLYWFAVLISAGSSSGFSVSLRRSDCEPHWIELDPTFGCSWVSDLLVCISSYVLLG